MRRKRVVESFENAATCIGPIEKEMSLFAITRGQFSMIDAIFHCLHAIGPPPKCPFGVEQAIGPQED